MNSNTSKNNNVHEEANRLFAKSLLLVCLFVMLTSAVARFFGILWFQADLDAIAEPSEFVRVAVHAILKIFELIFVHRILCKVSWKWCFLIAITQTAIVGFVNAMIGNIIDIFFIVLLPIAFNKDDWKCSLRDNILLYLLGLFYSATFLFGRVGMVYDAKRNFAVQVLTIIDYKILFVSLYLVVQLFGGIKLWKRQQKPFFKTKDQSIM